MVCAAASKTICKSEADKYCTCFNGGIPCNIACCDPCMNCDTGPGAPNGICAANTTCAQLGLGPCCGPKNQCCPAGFTCTNNKCTSPNAGCTGATCTTFIECSSSNPDCVCGTIAEGGGLCVPGSTPCAGLTPCSASGQCGSDSLCLIDSCCGVGVCVPISLSSQCPSVASSASFTRPSAVTTSGPTIGHR